LANEIPPTDRTEFPQIRTRPAPPGVQVTVSPSERVTVVREFKLVDAGARGVFRVAIKAGEIREAPSALTQSQCPRREVRAQHQGILFGSHDLDWGELVAQGISEFVAHYHGERNHQGLDNRLIIPDDSHAGNCGRLRCRERLGGMLNYYYRQAA
jgi:hypothetical protein